MRPIAFALAAALVMAGCKEDADEEPDIATLRIMAGTQTITISDNGTVTGGPLTVTVGTARAITATALKADGMPETRVTDAEFRLDVTPGAGTLTFTRTGPFAGNLNASAAGSTTISVQLFHIIENHPDFGPFNVPVTVN